MRVCVCVCVGVGVMCDSCVTCTRMCVCVCVCILEDRKRVQRLFCFVLSHFRLSLSSFVSLSVTLRKKSITHTTDRSALSISLSLFHSLCRPLSALSATRALLPRASSLADPTEARGCLARLWPHAH